ncbi:unnamed protein product [Calicophoron daubneyi]|uniref:Death domain-containing protein n=1 Tax=Calicophoron daubneyi TaxID=300641 RepID=A0AAV2TUJ5_CALDB
MSSSLNQAAGVCCPDATSCLQSLSVLRPLSCTSVYRSIGELTSKLRAELNKLDLEYRSESLGHESEFILESMRHIRLLAEAASKHNNSTVPEHERCLVGGYILGSIGRVEDLCFDAASTGAGAIGILDSLDKVKKVKSRIERFMLQRLGPVLEDFTFTVQFVEKYCQSFWNTNNDLAVYIPKLLKACENPQDKLDTNNGCTAVNEVRHRMAKETNSLQTLNSYEQYRLEKAKEIREYIAQVRQSALDFLHDGIRDGEIAHNTRQLGAKTKSMAAPFLLLVPNTLEKLRLVCELILNWLEMDKAYGPQIDEDLAHLQRIRNQYVRFQREVANSVTHWRYKQNRLTEDFQTLQTTVARMNSHRQRVASEYEAAELELDKLEILAKTTEIQYKQLRQKQKVYEKAQAARAQMKRHSEAIRLWQRAKHTMRSVFIAKKFQQHLIIMFKEDSDEKIIRRSREHKQGHSSKLSRTSRTVHGTEAASESGKTHNMERSRTLRVDPYEVDECMKRLLDLIHIRIPAAKRRKQEMRQRIKWFHQRDAELQTLRDQRELASRNCIQSESENSTILMILEKIDKAVRLLQHVRHLKTSPQTIRKLSLGKELKMLPDGINSGAESFEKTNHKEHIRECGTMETKSDQLFNKALKYVAEHIGNDWRSLFYSLPFDPPRGTVEMEQILARTSQRMPRADQIELTTVILFIWKQTNFAASLDLLCHALSSIGRDKLVTRIIRRYQKAGKKQENGRSPKISKKLGSASSNARGAVSSALTRNIQRLILPPISPPVHDLLESKLVRVPFVRHEPKWVGLPIVITKSPARQCIAAR